jgi:type 1 glutamine amidotransferase
MYRFRILASAAVLASFALLANISRADEPKADAAKKVQVLVLYGGHGFPEKSFREVFESFPDMKCTFVEEKVGGEAFENIDNWPYDAIVFYNFEKKPSDKAKENLLKLADRGVGLVVLHHGIHAYKTWPEFKKIAGITSFVIDSKDDVDYTVHVEDATHPIVKGLKDFAVKDETYKGNAAEADVHVILTTDEPLNYKAIAWTHTYHKSPVCFLQLGHGTSIYGQAEYRAVLGNAVRWVAGKLPADK